MSITTGDIPVTDGETRVIELHCANCGHFDDHIGEANEAVRAALEHVCCDRCSGVGWFNGADGHAYECDCREGL